MNKLYSSPWRVYLCVALLSVVGLVCGFKLPIALFPSSAKPSVSINFETGSMTSDEFLHSYGWSLEAQLLGITGKNFEVEEVEATYSAHSVNYSVAFKWGNSPTESFKETERVANAFAARMPSDLRDRMGIWQNRENTGFLAVSYYSERRSPTEVYDLVEPLLMNRVAAIKDAETPALYNPSSREIRVVLKPMVLASLRILPGDVMMSLKAALKGAGGGTVLLGAKKLNVLVPRAIENVDAFKSLPIAIGDGQTVPLGRIADVNMGPNNTSAMVFKTSGFSSLILFASPKPDGNIKKMSEDILGVVQDVQKQMPKDVHYKVLVDPSQFIRDAIGNVLREVGLAALLAVIVLYLFVGSLKNVATAAIEIPLSMVLAFILMKIFGVNLNLISLGGLALSAGLNVDASVVVMENIFRHFEDRPGTHSFATRLEIIVESVREVMAPVVSSTVASLVVFVPLIFTSDLSYAILGDLAKAIVFSHGCSAFVALILVPTIRLHIMGSGVSETHVEMHSPLERVLQKLENLYTASLARLMGLGRGRAFLLAGVFGLVVVSVVLVVPRLKREIIGTPDTDWIYMSISTQGNRQVQQMVASVDEIEARVLKDFGDKIDYTFCQIGNPNRASVMARLKTKKDMMVVWKAIEKSFSNTPFLKFGVFPWNPSEFEIPDPPQFLATIRGGDLESRTEMGRSLKDLIEEKQLYARVNAVPDMERSQTLQMSPRWELLARLQSQRPDLSLSTLSYLPYFATTPQNVDLFGIQGRQTPVILQFPEEFIQNPDDIASYPLTVGSKVVPLKALFNFEVVDAAPSVYRRNQRELIEVRARLDQDDLDKKESVLAQAKEAVQTWEAARGTNSNSASAPPSLTFEDADVDLNTALHQLGVAVALSVSLILLILLFQFGKISSALLILVSIPLGILGVTTSLFIFKSTLSLNSVLGVILLNGIAVANSILLVDFTAKLVERGRSPREAALEAAKKRLRPILITSLTTILGMLPVAIGLGEGGRVLQPLGIAVSGGLWVSMLLTLFIVPTLQVMILERKVRR